MPGPTLGQGQTYPLPPDSLKTVNPELYEYLYMVHIRMFGAPGGTGDLDSDNISTGDAAFNVHGSSSGHTSLVQGTAVSDSGITTSTVLVESDDTAPIGEGAEDTLLAELKLDLNTLVTDTNTALSALETTVNALLAALRTAKIIAT